MNHRAATQAPWRPCRLLLLLLLLLLLSGATSLSLPSSFLGRPLSLPPTAAGHDHPLVMRKQKASDKRTRQRQRGLLEDTPVLTVPSSSWTTSPMQAKGAWKTKAQVAAAPTATSTTVGGRGRSRKRSAVYTSLSFYHNKFLQLLQAEYEAEVRLHRFACAPILHALPLRIS
jgi:hypothetical protein